jgi:AcrR family transcriptional regulator
MNKNESKYFNTAIKMDEALISLLEKKDFEYITIKEICDTAGVNRSTFYLHYENTTDLLQETTKYIIDKHFAYYNVDKKDVIVGIEEKRPSEMIFITEEYLTPYLTFIKDNRRIFQVAIKQFDALNMEKVYDTLFRLVFEPVLEQFRVPQNKRPFVIKFYLSGVFAVVMEWIKNDCEEDIKVIIEIILDCVMGDRNING